MNVLVTGAAGFDWKIVINTLVKQISKLDNITAYSI